MTGMTLPERLAEQGSAVGAAWGGSEAVYSLESGGRIAPQAQRACLILAVNSCTRLYTERSSRIMRAIFEVA
jgi:hypothetical protein